LLNIQVFPERKPPVWRRKYLDREAVPDKETVEIEDSCILTDSMSGE
jgi:hypothetical protein